MLKKVVISPQNGMLCRFLSSYLPQIGCYTDLCLDKYLVGGVMPILLRIVDLL